MFYRLEKSLEKKINGPLGIQCSEFNIDYDESDINSVYNYDLSDPNCQPNLPDIILNKKVPFTDFIECSYFLDELIISERIKNFLEKECKLPNYHFFEKINVFDSRMNKSENEYYFFYYEIELNNYIDFNKSTFSYYEYGYNEVYTIKCKSSQELSAIRNSKMNCRLYSNNLVFKNEEIDIFKLFGQSTHFVSEKIKNEFKDFELLGVEFKEVKNVYGTPPDSDIVYKKFKNYEGFKNKL